LADMRYAHRVWPHLDDFDRRLGVVETKDRQLRVLVVLDDRKHGVAGTLSSHGEREVSEPFWRDGSVA
jgi:hypothetical protein